MMSLQGIEGGGNKVYPLKGSGVSIRLRVGDAAPPADVTVVEEQDRFLLLRRDNEIDDTGEHPIRLHTDLVEQQPLPTASVRYRSRRYQAIVYDVDADPISHPAWVADCYRHLLIDSLQRRIDRLYLPLLGCRYRIVTPAESLRLLHDQCREVAKEGASLELYLDVPRDQLAPLIARLTALAPSASAKDG